MFLSSLWTPLLTRSTEHGPHVTCVNWNELQCLACATMQQVATGCNVDTRSVVAPKTLLHLNYTRLILYGKLCVNAGWQGGMC